MNTHILGLQLYCFEHEFSDSELMHSETDYSDDCSSMLSDSDDGDDSLINAIEDDATTATLMATL